MAYLESWSGTISNWVLAALRIVTALLIVQHGGQKLFNFLPGPGAYPLQSIMGLAGVLEVVGGVLIFVGLFTRPAAFILSAEMAVAYFRAHFPNGYNPLQNGGELAVIYCFVFLHIAAAGPGALSLGEFLAQRKQNREYI
jgi:putative oxidoreductase